MQRMLLTICVVMSAASAANTTPASGVHVSNETIQATLKKAPANSVTDQQIRVVDVGKANVGIGVVHRSAAAAQTAIEHDELTEVYHVIRGSATLVTGGTLLNPRREAPDSKVVRELNGPTMRGSTLQNGESQRIGPGDVVIIPPGVGHWFSSVDGSIDYLVVRVDPDKALGLK